MPAKERIALAEAIVRTIAVASKLPTLPVATHTCAGRVLADDVTYTTDLPAFDHAAMDGYALAGAASAGTSFVVRGESRAGGPSDAAIADGEAIAISTGAAMPAGTTTVVPWEDTERAGDRITLTRDVAAPQHVRPAGEDATAGALAVAGGTRLSPRHVAVLLAADHAKVKVHETPRVSILSTGDELTEPGQPRSLGQIVDTNGPLIAALVASMGATSNRISVPDRDGALASALELSATTSHVAVTIGGAADGEHDYVARAVDTLGGKWIYRGVAIKPGKPVSLARIGELLVLALPGNPGSAFVTFTLLGMPLLAALEGQADARPCFLRARTLTPLRASSDRLTVVYGTLETRGLSRVFVPAPPTPSGSVPALAGASALGLVPIGAPCVENDELDVLPVDPR